MRQAQNPLDALALFLSRVSAHVSLTLVFDILAALTVIALAFTFIRTLKNTDENED